jgi:nucleoside diphosphate kinase
MQGYTLRGLKFMNVTKAHAEAHYADLASKPFFPSACHGKGHAAMPLLGCSLRLQ